MKITEPNEIHNLTKTDAVDSFIYPTDAQPDCSKGILKFALKFT
jgi:hypothetical protein